MKILLPVDGSDFTQRTLDFIASHETLFGPSHAYMALTVVTAIPAHACRFLDRNVVDEYYAEEADKVLAPLREFASQHLLSITMHHVIGHAAEGVAAFAREQQPDLVIMGSHGRSAIANLVLGSVTAGILARCAIPVLIVR